MNIDRKDPAELLNWMWERIDKAARKEKETWISDQLDAGNIKGLVEWGYEQLNKDDQREMVEWTFNPGEMSDAALSNTTNGVLEGHYDNGNNPIEAWKAINLCLEGNRPFPAWVNEYLLQVSQKILTIETLQDTGAREEIYKAIGIRGPGLTAARKRQKKKEFCLEIETLIKEGRSNSAAYRVYAKAHGLKWKTIQSYHVAERKNPAYWLWLGIDPP